MFYKYRTLDNFKFVVDIFVNQRFYATTIEDMNDPMEGTYTFNDDIPQDAISALEDYQKKIKFCSLSKNEDSLLMWAHYSNGARGIIIGVELLPKSDFREVKYKAHLTCLATKQQILKGLNVYFATKMIFGIMKKNTVCLPNLAILFT